MRLSPCGVLLFRRKTLRSLNQTRAALSMCLSLCGVFLSPRETLRFLIQADTSFQCVYPCVVGCCCLDVKLFAFLFKHWAALSMCLSQCGVLLHSRKTLCFLIQVGSSFECVYLCVEFCCLHVKLFPYIFKC